MRADRSWESNSKIRDKEKLMRNDDDFDLDFDQESEGDSSKGQESVPQYEPSAPEPSVREYQAPVQAPPERKPAPARKKAAKPSKPAAAKKAKIAAKPKAKKAAKTTAKKTAKTAKPAAKKTAKKPKAAKK